VFNLGIYYKNIIDDLKDTNIKKFNHLKIKIEMIDDMISNNYESIGEFLS